MAAWRSAGAVILAVLGLPIAAVAAHTTCTVERVSIDSAGNPANESSGFASLSAGGRYVAFMSYASNLVDNDTNLVDDIFVHDRISGVTERVSVDSSGNQAMGVFGAGSGFPSISGDGRYVAFESEAPNLVAGDLNGAEHIFVHDRATGVTELASVDSSARQADSASFLPALSGDGRYVAFQSLASNLVPGDTNVCEGSIGPFPVLRNCSDIFVHDRQTSRTERVSIDSAGFQADGDSRSAAISADGRFVAFHSDATNLVPADTNARTDVFVHDRDTGVTERVSVDTAGNQGNGDSTQPSLSADGRFVLFGSRATNLGGGMPGLFMHDRMTGSTKRIGSGDAAISADGRFAVVGALDIFVYDRVTGKIGLASADVSGNPGSDFSFDPVISADGQTVAFSSRAKNLAPPFGDEGNTSFQQDIFVSSACAVTTCAGDCDTDGIVAVDELVTGVNIALGAANLDACESLDRNDDGQVTVDELVAAVNVALVGCRQASPDAMVYRLVSDSDITPPDAGNPPRIEGLFGTVVVVPTEPLPPNTLFDFTIKTVRLRSGAFYGTEYAVDGTIGRVTASTLDPAQPLTIHLSVTINGQPVELDGVGSPETFTTDPHPALSGVHLSGGGYQLVLFADPEL